MKSFRHVNARTVEEAVAILSTQKGKAVVNAGGTDVLGILKDEILPRYPKVIINIKTIVGLQYIREEEGVLKIGALTKLCDIAESPIVKERYGVLAEAARSVATPQIRHAATIGGNLCQDVRCWYYRYPRHIGGPILCARKGKGPCHAVRGDNRYHAVLGAKKCFAVCASDTAVSLAALDARMVIAGPEGERKMAITDFFHSLRNALKIGEIVREVEVPVLKGPARQRFIKFRLREAIDFAMVSVASVIAVKDGICAEARVALGALAPGPVRTRAAEELLTGTTINEEIAAEAASGAVAGARPLRHNGYKLEIAGALVKRAILGTES